jgi:hypothetical protein
MAVGVVSLVLLAFAPAADAAQRYASPTGSGTACASGAPCSLNTAVGKASAGDEVIIGTGEYLVETLEAGEGLESELFNVDIHGDLAAPMPRIVLEGGGAFGIGMFLNAAGQRLAWVELVGRGKGAEIFATLACLEATIERVRVSVEDAQLGSAISVGPGCVVKNSLATAAGPVTAIGSGSGTGGASSASVINSTAIATGTGAVAVSASWDEPLFEFTGSFRLDLTNTIARGSRADLLASAPRDGTATIAVSHSNFATAKAEPGGSIADGGGNQATLPVFADPLFGNFAEATGSPTIDGGITTPAAGSLDLAGSPRTQGGSTDIGAYEAAFVATPTLTAVAVKPKSFAVANVGGAVISKKKGGKKKLKAKVGATVSYSLSAAGSVSFSVERKTVKRVGKKRKKKVVFKAIKGGFSVSGAAGANSFKFSGRIGTKGLKPGSYRLIGAAGGVVKRTGFTIVK